jgi:hypothetical protein
MADKPDCVFQVVMMLLAVAVFGMIFYGFVSTTTSPAGAGMKFLITLAMFAGAALALSGMWRISHADPKGSRASLISIVLGAFAAGLFLIAQGLFHSGFTLRRPARWEPAVLEILSAFIILAAYWIAARALCAAAKLEQPYWRRSLSRLPIGLVSYVVWLNLFILLTAWTEDTPRHDPAEVFISLLIPLVAAYVIYRLGVWLFVDGPRKEEDTHAGQA